MINTQWDAIIIGAGAAGLWAAGTAAARGRRILLLEKNNKAGPKILMSGGTRCNITHHCDVRLIAEAFGRQGKALLSPLQRLSPQAVVEHFHAEGVATKIEETGKIFPASDRAIDVRDALVKRLEREGATLKTGSPVTSIDWLEASSPFPFQVHTPQATYTSAHLLVTTGGLSYPGCGTTGDAYPWLERLGHTLTPRRPALTPLLSHAPWVHALSGLTLPDALVTAVLPGPSPKPKRERLQSRGGLLWTHFGLSGPTAMNVSRSFSEEGVSEAWLHLDLLPDASLAWLEEQLMGASVQGNKAIVNVLAQWVPKRIAETLMQLAEVPMQVKASELSKRHRQLLVESLKSLRVPIHGTRGYAKAEVTAGGVPLNEVNFQDMQSRVKPGLFLAGEILDLDGPIGGFNFQAAWSTGHTAGLHL